MLVFGAVNVPVSINYSVGNSVNHPLQNQKRQNHARSYLLPHRWGQGVCEDHPKSPPHHDTATSAPSSIPKVCCVASASSCCGTWGWKLSGSPWGKVSASSLSSSSCLAENPSTSLLNGVFSSFIILSFELFFSDGTWFGCFLCIFRGTSPIFWTETSTCTMFKCWFGFVHPPKCRENQLKITRMQRFEQRPPASSHHPVRLRVHSYCGRRAHHSGLHFPPPVALEMQPSEHHPSNLWASHLLGSLSNFASGQTDQ